jgi:Arc/MetJ-type ribon-helix-helix transcriptional regulator
VVVPQIAIRLSDEELAALDQLVAARNYESRAAAMREALTRALKAEEDRQIAAQYERAYGNRPPTQEEIDIGETGAILLGQFYEQTGEPPWELDEEEKVWTPKPDVQLLHQIEVVAEQLLGLAHQAAEQRRQAS